MEIVEALKPSDQPYILQIQINNSSYLPWCLILVTSDLCLCSLPVCSSSSSVSWPSLQRSGCSTTTSLHGPLSWATASGCLHSSVCLRIWSSTCSMPREHSNRYSMSCLYSLLCFFSFSSPPWPLFSNWQLSSNRDCLCSFPCTVRVDPLQRSHDDCRSGSKEHAGGTGQRLKLRKKATSIDLTHTCTRTVGYYQTTDSPTHIICNACVGCHVARFEDKG